MSESVHVPPAKLDASRAVLAGLIATAAITISLAFFGQNIMKMLGSMMLPNGSVGTQYAVGGAVHLTIGLFYAVVFAALFGKVREWNPVLKAGVFGLAITAVALAAMPVMAAMLGGGKGSNPCGGAAKAGMSKAANPGNPCAAKPAAAGNPCATKPAAAGNPCAAKSAGNPCNPCAAKKAANPCNPCAAKKAANPCNPCAAKGAANPCKPAAQQAANPCGGGKGPCSGTANPCNPCGGGGPYSGAISALNHLIYAFVLTLVYRARPA
jgi:hypothetical protein